MVEVKRAGVEEVEKEEVQITTSANETRCARMPSIFLKGTHFASQSNLEPHARKYCVCSVRGTVWCLQLVER